MALNMYDSPVRTGHKLKSVNILQLLNRLNTQKRQTHKANRYQLLWKKTQRLGL